jgi:CRP-like cAMP-binding protein
MLDSNLDRTPPKHDANWTLGIARDEAFPEPAEKPARHLTLGSRETIIDEGDESRAVYLLLEGAVMLSKLLPDGRRQIIELLGPGDLFGFSTTARSDVSAETLRPARLVAYDRRTVATSTTLQALIAERMNAQLCGLHDHAMLLGRKSAVERVATFLMRMVPRRGGMGCAGPGAAADRVPVKVPLTRQEIADYLGLTLETVSRAFSLLKRQGLLVYGRHDEVMIADVCRLCRTTGSH